MKLAILLCQQGAHVKFYLTANEFALIYHKPANLIIEEIPSLIPQSLPESIRNAHHIILASDNEPFNLHATLHIKSIYPELKILTRSFNLAIGHEIELRLAQVKVFSVSDRSAPYFAAAAFYDEIGSAWNQDQELYIKQTQPGQDNSAIQVKAEDFRHFGPHPKPKLRRKKNKRPDYLLLSVLLGLVGVISSGTLYFWLRHQLPPGDALYFVVTTLTTTGYGDYSLKDFPFVTKLAGMSLMLAGASLFAILFALLTDKLFQARLAALLGHRRVRRSGHVVLCGAASVGHRPPGLV